MATIATSQNLTAVSYAQAEQLTIVNGAVLTVNASTTVNTGSFVCTTKGKLLWENASTTTPIVIILHDQDNDLRFEANAIFEVRGAMMELGTGTGAAQTFNFTSLYGGVIPQVTYCEIEEVAGSGIYMAWPIYHEDPLFDITTVSVSTRGGTPQSYFGAGFSGQNALFWHATNKTLRCGDNVNGNAIPSGCKIRIPNIYADTRLKLNENKNHVVFTVGTPTGGTFTITIDGNGTTGNIAYNASATTIRTAIEAVAGIGAGQVTTSGGALPTSVTISWAGTMASARNGLRIGASALTGGTSSHACVGANAASDSSSIDLAPSGTMDCECVCFSDNIRLDVNGFAKVRLHKAGIGNDRISLADTNGEVDIDGLSNTCNPYMSSNGSQLSNILGPATMRRVVSVKKNSGTTFQVSNVPKLERVDRVYYYCGGDRDGTGNRGLTFATLQKGFIAEKTESNGASMQLTNLTDAVFNDYGYGDTLKGVQDTNNSVSAIATQNCVNPIIANFRKSGVGSSRGSIFNTDTASSNVSIIGGSYDGSDNTPAAMFLSCAGASIKNFNLSNVRGGPLIDVISTFLGSGLTVKKCFATYVTAQSGNGLDPCQDGEYDLLSSSIAGIGETFSAVNNFVGGNYAENSLTPTTGHVTFGPFGAGTGLELTGEAFTNQLGGLAMPADGDTAVIEMPFNPHAITAFDNSDFYFYADGRGVLGFNHAVINDGGVTGGTFTISVYDASLTLLGTTGPIVYNASTATVVTALEVFLGAGNVTASGVLSTKYFIDNAGALATTPLTITADGSALTGGTKPGTIDYHSRARSMTLTEKLGAGYQVQFAMRVPGTAWPAYQTFSGANIAAAIPALTGYLPFSNEDNGGLGIRIKLTAVGNDPYRLINQISFPTQISPASWTVGDGTLNLQGPALTDITTLYRSSDDAVLGTFVGGGVKELTVGSNFLVDAYFVRRNASAVEIMRTQAAPIKLKFGDNGNIDLFAGAEVNLAQSSTLDALHALIDERLDVILSTRLASAAYIAPDNASVTAIKAKTDEIHAIKGLDVARPLTVTPASMVAGAITVTLGGDGTTITTATRAP